MRMNLDEQQMIRLLQKLNQDYLEIAQFLTSARNEHERLAKIGDLGGIYRVLSDVIESTEREIDRFTESLVKIRRKI